MLDPQEERAKFISLHELLFILAEAKGYSPQQAAQSLSQTVSQNEQWRRLPMHHFDPATGLVACTYKEAGEALKRLALLARTGDSLTHQERLDDDIPF